MFELLNELNVLCPGKKEYKKHQFTVKRIVFIFPDSIFLRNMNDFVNNYFTILYYYIIHYYLLFLNKTCECSQLTVFCHGVPIAKIHSF